MSEMPFAKDSGRIAMLSQQLWQQDFVRVNTDLAGVIERSGQSNSIRIAAGHQRSSRSRADRLRDVEAGESRPFFRQPVDVGRANVFRSETADVRVTEIIREDQHDVRWWDSV